MLKTFTSTTFVGIESLYKPTGNPSFELLSYIMDADIDTIRLVLDDQTIDPTQMFACGDIKDVFSKKVFKPAIVVRVDKPNNQALVDQILHLKRLQGPKNTSFYDGHPRDFINIDRIEDNQARSRGVFKNFLDREAKGQIN